VLRDTNVTFLRMSDQQGESARAPPTGEDAAGCGAEAAELSRDESFGSERSEPNQAGSRGGRSGRHNCSRSSNRAAVS
jgi:hypothetical protein